jgi:hypothetical protein
MRDPKRISNILALLSFVWRQYPDLRLGQLIDNALYNNGVPIDLFYVEDDDLESALMAFHKKYKEKR